MDIFRICTFVCTITCMYWLFILEYVSAIICNLPDGPHLIYHRDYLMQIGLQTQHAIDTDLSRGNFPEELSQPADSHAHKCNQKRGKGGIKAREAF